MDEFAGVATPLDHRALTAAAALLGCSPEQLWSVALVETGGVGFLPDGRPRLLFERHLFHRLTAGRFDLNHPDLSGPPGSYGAPGAHQYDRLAAALILDRKAALMSASWGLGQTLGQNHRAAGFAEVEAMVTAYAESEAAQLAGLARFIASEPAMASALRSNDWSGFARRYNGPGYAANHYDRRLAGAFARILAEGFPDWPARAGWLRRAPAPAQAR